MSKRSYRNRESKTFSRPDPEARTARDRSGVAASDGESPAKLIAWLWGVPIALITLAVVLKVTGVS